MLKSHHPPFVNFWEQSKTFLLYLESTERIQIDTDEEEVSKTWKWGSGPSVGRIYIMYELVQYVCIL